MGLHAVEHPDISSLKHLVLPLLPHELHNPAKKRWATEIIVLLSGTLPDPEANLAAMTIFANTCAWPGSTPDYKKTRVIFKGSSKGWCDPSTISCSLSLSIGMSIRIRIGISISTQGFFSGVGFEAQEAAQGLESSASVLAL